MSIYKCNQQAIQESIIILHLFRFANVKQFQQDFSQSFFKSNLDQIIVKQDFDQIIVKQDFDQIILNNVSSSKISTKPKSSRTSTKAQSIQSSNSRASTKAPSSESRSSQLPSTRSTSSRSKISSTTTNSKVTSPAVISSTSTSSRSGLGFVVTRPTSLDALGQSFYSHITSGITLNGKGTILGHLKEATATSSLPAVTADPMDRSAQPSLQSQLQDVGLPSFETTTSNILAAMDSALMGNVSTNGTGDFDNWEGSDNNTTLSKRSHTHLAKRDFFGDFMEGIDMSLCNDFVTTLLETADDICKVKEGVEAIYCLATGCYKQAASLPPPVEYPFDSTYSLKMPSFKGGYVYKDATSTLVCNDCGMTVSKLEIKGTIVVDLQSATILSSTMTLNQDSVQRFNMDIYTTGPATGSWSYVMSTLPLQSISISGVFTISPQALYAIGATWSTSGAADLSFGATSTLSDASVDFDPILSGYQGSSNWVPTLDVLQPKLTGSSATLTPWIQGSIQISLQILGHNYPNAVTINSQVSLGFTNAYVTMAKLGHSRCSGGQLQSTAYQSVVNTLQTTNFGTNYMYSSSKNSAPVCEDAQVAPASAAQESALKIAPGAGLFCSSFIGYKPATVNATIVQTLTKATSTVSVVGSGTTTITPSTVTSSVTITSSVSSIARNMKRTLTTTADPSSLERRNLVARRVVPTPVIVSTWLPQQVSHVCSLIATGATQVNVTSTRLLSSGVTTATIQGTVTAATPIATSTSVIFAPDVVPYNVVVNPDISSVLGQTTPWIFSGASNNYHWVTITSYAQLLGTGSLTQVLTDLEPGWTYNLTLAAGFGSTTDTCTVTYSLDGVPIESYSPSNTGVTPGGTGFFHDKGAHTIQLPDGPYQVVATATTQTLGISMSCAADGGFAEFSKVDFWGPLAESD
ncbi:hypothetical protein D6D01_06813 [Aureobasidium pullulans]|uniref:Uncharacterized protein n=1 Tax=Aureobasidium pullulans TaxID=5580 RepID=A0A4S9KWC8_AURPU|nr:hypothetical protein D6D01_06813 [Aureobasidium pullulans]